MPELHGRGLHVDALTNLQRQYPEHRVATLERAVNYNGGSLEASKRLISAVQVGDEDRCRPKPRSLLPADGWKTDLVPDPFVLPPDSDQIQSLPSRQYQMGTEKNYFDELQQCLDKAVQAAQNRKNAAKMGGRASRPRSAIESRPWLRRPSKNDLPPPEWQDTRTPCVLCRRESTREHKVLTTVAEGLCAACHAYFVSLGAGDRPDLAWLRWEHDGIIPEPEPQPVCASSERRRASGMTQQARFKSNSVTGAAARRHQAAIKEARRLREESGFALGGRKPVGSRLARPKSAVLSGSQMEESAQTKSELARFRAKAARQKFENQESKRAAKAKRIAMERRIAAATTAKDGGPGSAATGKSELSAESMGKPYAGTPRVMAKGNKLDNRLSGRRETNSSRSSEGSSATSPSPALVPSASSSELESSNSSKTSEMDIVEAEDDKLRAAEQAAAAAHAVATHPQAWETFCAIVSYHGGSCSPPAAGARMPFEAIRGYLTSLGEAEFAATRASIDCFVPGASPTRGTPRGSHIDAAISAVEQSGGITFERFTTGYQSWQLARGAHRSRTARLMQDMEERSAVRRKEKLVKRIDVLVANLARQDDRTDGRVSVEGGLRRMVAAISHAAFTDGLASAQGQMESATTSAPASGHDLGMDPAMLKEVHRTAEKIGGDIGDGVSVAHMALADMLLDVFEGDAKTLASVEKILLRDII